MLFDILGVVDDIGIDDNVVLVEIEGVVEIVDKVVDNVVVCSVVVVIWVVVNVCSVVCFEEVVLIEAIVGIVVDCVDNVVDWVSVFDRLGSVRQIIDEKFFTLNGSQLSNSRETFT